MIRIILPVVGGDIGAPTFGKLPCKRNEKEHESWEQL